VEDHQTGSSLPIFIHHIFEFLAKKGPQQPHGHTDSGKAKGIPWYSSAYQYFFNTRQKSYDFGKITMIFCKMNTKLAK
jgi:hypothetical protein